MKLFDLTGEVAFVTGAGSGIGASIAIGLAEAGANVALFGRESRKQGLEETAVHITALGRKALIIHGCVTKGQDLDRAVDQVVGEFGSLTIGVNNAGIAFAQTAQDMSLEQWNKLYDTNVAGVFLSCQAEGRVMMKDQGGSIINIASISGIIANRGLNQEHYNSSKAAVIHLSKSLAAEWAPYCIRVNTISPGLTRTPMNTRPEVADQMEIFEAETPLQRSASPDEMAGPAIFLASRAASFVTGLNLVVDGGFTVW